jgi:hypothetical protein
MYLSPEKHVYLKLVTSPTVARLIGFQVYPIAVPNTNAEMPFLVYRRASIVRDHGLPGPMFTPVVNLQIAAWARSYGAVRELAEEVRLVLDGHIGTLAGVTIQDMRLTSEVDDFLDPTVSGSQLPPAYEVRQLYQIRWQEAAE